uniref:Nucleotide exchange factor SIL1 n=1 Tax=Panagrolaimus sp. ES5 TaxID=591445 RepID=A0AC34GS82_9BILA
MSNNSLVPVNNETTTTTSESRSTPFDSSHLLSKLKDTIEHIIQLCEDTENDTDNTETELIAIAEELHNVSDYYVGSITFCKMGGLKSIKAAMEHSSFLVKANYLDVLATISQNNEEVQDFVYKNSNLLPDLSDTVQKGNLATIYRCKIVFALSSLVRGNPEGKRLFFDECNGVETLRIAFQNAFNEDDSRAAGRIAVVVFHFFQDSSEDSKRQTALKELILNVRGKMNMQHSAYESSLDYIKDL